MRVPIFAAVLFVSAAAAASPACATRLNLPDNNAVAWSAYSAQPIESPWAPQRPEVQLGERPIADLIALKLGIAQGSAQLFRFRLEHAPSNATVLRGQLDGGGIKLKLTW